MRTRPNSDHADNGTPPGPSTTMEQLGRCLEALEELLGRRVDGSPPVADEPYDRRKRFDAAAHLDAAHESSNAGTQASGGIAAELMQIREEIRRRIAASVRSDFQALREGIERGRGVPGCDGGIDLAREVERIAAELLPLGDTSEAVAGVAHDELEAIGGLREKLAGGTKRPGAEAAGKQQRDHEQQTAKDDRVHHLWALADRLEQIGAAVHNLPDSLSLRTLEEKLRALATAVEHLVSRSPAFGSETFTQIEVRLDEISRAIVASTIAAQSAQIGLEPFQRIEARVAALARQIEEVVRERPSGEVLERLGALAQRIDGIAERMRLPEETLQRMSDQIAAVARKVESAPASPEMQPMLSGIERRFDLLSGALERRHEETIDQGSVFMREIGRRLDEVVDKLGEEAAKAGPAALVSGIEERLVRLAGAVERHHGDEPERENRLLREIGRRLDEAVGKLGEDAAKADPAALVSGIEARLGELAGTLERHHGEQVEREGRLLREIGRRLDGVAGRLGEDSAALLSGIETRFDGLAGEAERRHDEALELGKGLLREFEVRIDGVADIVASRQSGAGDAVAQAVEVRLTALGDHLGESLRGTGAGLERLDGRLEGISQGLDRLSGHLAGMDSDLIGRLVAQVAALSANLRTPVGPPVMSQDLGARLDAIETRIVDGREALFEAARQAAGNAVRSLAGNPPDDASLAALAGEVKALDTLARRSDERNSRAFEAIHDTLLKIVARLGSREVDTSPDGTGSRGPAEEAPPRSEVVKRADAAALALPLPPAQAEPSTAGPVALSGESLETALVPPSGQRRSVRSMFGGLFSGRKEREPESRREARVDGGEDAVPSAPPVSLDEPGEPGLSNRPLEPGSRPPDLNAIMKRVREERVHAVKGGDADAARSDFIAAARRAAQAAAAEAEVLKRKSDIGGPVKALRIGDLLKSRRRPLLMAGTGIALALAGVGLGRSLVSDAFETAALEAPARLSSAAVNEASRPDAPPLRSADPHGTSAGVGLHAAAETPGATEELPVRPAPQSAEKMASTPAAGLSSEVGVPFTGGPPALRQAADSGDRVALFEVASRLAEGRGAGADPAQAARLYEKAAELGLAPAQYRIGNLYEKGIGVARDVARSKSWYERAALQGNAGAMHNLAVLLSMGAGGKTDSEGAARWFASAAEHGVKDSQFNLGVLAAKGIGMQRNLVESYKWFALAARSGDEDAAGKRDEVAEALEPAQLDKARAAVENWTPRPLDTAANTVPVPEEWTDRGTQAEDGTRPIREVQFIPDERGFDAGSAGVTGAGQEDIGTAPTGELDATLVGALLKGE